MLRKLRKRDKKFKAATRKHKRIMERYKRWKSRKLYIDYYDNAIF